MALWFNLRRDIIEFLLRYPAGEDLLMQRDTSGRIPLFYAERSGNESLMHPKAAHLLQISIFEDLY